MQIFKKREVYKYEYEDIPTNVCSDMYLDLFYNCHILTIIYICR